MGIHDELKISFLPVGFTDVVWDLQVTETNWYAHDHQLVKPTPWAFDDVDIDKIKASIVLMGILRLPRLEMYWSTWELHMYISTPGISSLFTKTHFEQIFQFLHVANNAEQPATPTTPPDKLFKIRPLANLLLAYFQSKLCSTTNCYSRWSHDPFQGTLVLQTIHEGQ